MSLYLRFLFYVVVFVTSGFIPEMEGESVLGYPITIPDPILAATLSPRQLSPHRSRPSRRHKHLAAIPKGRKTSPPSDFTPASTLLRVAKKLKKNEASNILRRPFQQMTSRPFSTVDKFSVYLEDKTSYRIDDSLEGRTAREQRVANQEINSFHRQRNIEVANCIEQWERDRLLCSMTGVLQRQEAEVRKHLKESEKIARLPIRVHAERLITRHTVRVERQARAEIRRKFEAERLRKMRELIAQLSKQEEAKRKYYENEQFHSVELLQRINTKSGEHAIRLGIEVEYRRGVYAAKREFQREADRLRQYLLRREEWLKKQTKERESQEHEEDESRRSTIDDEKTTIKLVSKQMKSQMEEILEEIKRQEEQLQQQHEALRAKFLSYCQEIDTSEAKQRATLASDECTDRRQLRNLSAAAKSDAKNRQSDRLLREKEMWSRQHSAEKDLIVVEEENIRKVILNKATCRGEKLFEWYDKVSTEIHKPIYLSCNNSDLYEEWDSDKEDPEDESIRRHWWRRKASRHRLLGGSPINTITEVPIYMMKGSDMPMYQSLDVLHRRTHPDNNSTCTGQDNFYTGMVDVIVKINKGSNGQEMVKAMIQEVPAPFHDTTTRLKFVPSMGVILVTDSTTSILCDKMPTWNSNINTMTVRINIGKSEGKRFTELQLAMVCNVIRSFSFATTEDSDDKLQHRNVRVMLSVSFEAHETEHSLNLHIPMTVSVTPPLFVIPEESKVLFKPQGGRTLELFPKVILPQLHPDLNVGRLLRGSKLSIDFSEGFSEGDTIALSNSVSISHGIFTVDGSNILKAPDASACPFINSQVSMKSSSYTVIAASLGYTQNRSSLQEVFKGNSPLEAIVSFIRSLRFVSTSSSRPCREVTVQLADLSNILVTSITVMVKMYHKGEPIYMEGSKIGEPPPIHRLNALCHPKHVQFFEPIYTSVFNRLLLQSTELDGDKVDEGSLTVTICNGVKGDQLTLLTDDTISVEYENDDPENEVQKVYVKELKKGIIVSHEVGTLLIESDSEGGAVLVIEFANPDGGVKLSAIQRIIKGIAYSLDEGMRKSGTKKIELRLRPGDRPEVHMIQFIKVCQPSIDMPPHYQQQEYKEGQGAKRLALFDSEVFESSPEDQLSEGTVVVEVLNQLDEDKISISTYNNCDFSINPNGNKSFICSNITDHQVGWFYNGSAALSGTLKIYISVRRGQQPVLIKRDIVGMLRGLAYTNNSRDPQELRKYIRVTLSGPSCGVSQLLLELAINTVNDPTMMIVPHTEVTYAPNTKGSEWGCLVAEGAAMEDPDTRYISPGGVLTAELVAGGGLGSGDTFSLISPEHQSVLYPDSNLVLNYEEESGRLELNNLFCATVTVKEERSITVRFLPQNPKDVTLEIASYILRCITFNSNGTPTRVGVRSFILRFNAGDHPVSDTKIKITIDVIPPLIFAPAFTHNALYKEGQMMMLNGKVSSGRIGPNGSLQGCEIWVEITDGFVGSQDELHFIAGRDCSLQNNSIFLAGTKTPVGILTKQNNKVSIKCDDKSRGVGGKLQQVVRCFHYYNSSKSPDTHPRTIDICMSQNGSLSVIQMNIDIQSIDDMTNIILAKQTHFYIADSKPVLPFSSANVFDDDTEVFEAPHSFLKAEMPSSCSNDILSILTDEEVSIDPSSQLVSVGNRDCGIWRQKNKGFHIDLSNCAIADLQTIIRSITYGTKDMRQCRGMSKVINLFVRGGPSVPVTRVSMGMDLFPMFIEIPRAKSEKAHVVSPTAPYNLYTTACLRFVGGSWIQGMAPHVITIATDNRAMQMLLLSQVCFFFFFFFFFFCCCRCYVRK